MEQRIVKGCLRIVKECFRITSRAAEIAFGVLLILIGTWLSSIPFREGFTTHADSKNLVLIGVAQLPFGLWLLFRPRLEPGSPDEVSHWREWLWEIGGSVTSFAIAWELIHVLSREAPDFSVWVIIPVFVLMSTGAAIGRRIGKAFKMRDARKVDG